MSYDVGVIGSGTMGTQIAVALSAAGHQVFLYNHQDVEQARPKLLKLAKLAVRRDPTNSLDTAILIQRIQLISTLAPLSRAAIVIEAVVEDLAIKQGIFGAIDRACPQAKVLASNTSSLSLEKIGQATRNTGRVLGLHVFNPVFDTRLVEVIPTTATSPECIAEALALVHSLKKIPILFPQSCVNRLLIPMINEACHALEQGMGKAEDIDLAMKAGANHPIGPLALADLIGLDVVVAILESLEQRYGSRYHPAKTLYDLISKGHLGRKAQRGFFKYGKEL